MKDVGKNWFTNRVVGEWNKLREYVVGAETTDSFIFMKDVGKKLVH